MKVAVVGPGALGTFLAGIIGQYEDVLLLGRIDHEIQRISIRGRTSVESDIRYTTDIERLADCRYILLCTKSYDTRQAMGSICEQIDDDARVVSLQNGLKNERIISRYVAKDRVIGGVTSHGVTYESPGNVFHAGEGETYLGLYPGGVDGSVDEFASLLRNGGLEVTTVDNIYSYIWQKVIVNASINPLTALTGLKNGALLEHGDLNELMKAVCEESYRVAREETDLPGKHPLDEVETVASRTAENRSSMLQDIERDRRTEIDCINGAIVDVGAKVGVDTPLNRTLYALVKGREREK